MTTEDISDALNEATGVDINRRRVSQQPLRDIGMHRIPVRLGGDVSPVLNVRIVAEDDRVELERQQEAHKQGLLDQVRFDEDGRLVAVDVARLRRKQEKAAEEEAAETEVEAAVEALQDTADSVVDAAGDAVDAVQSAASDAVSAVTGDDDDADNA